MYDLLNVLRTAPVMKVQSDESSRFDIIACSLAPCSFAVTMWTEFAGFGHSTSLSARALPAVGTASARYQKGLRASLWCPAPCLSRPRGGMLRRDLGEGTGSPSRKVPGPYRPPSEACGGRAGATTTPCPNRGYEACLPPCRALPRRGSRSSRQQLKNVSLNRESCRQRARRYI